LVVPLSVAPTALAAPPPAITAEGALLVDLDTGQVLFSQNADQRYYPASTTKIMTALLALERGHLTDVLTAGEIVRNCDGSRIYLEPGEQETLEDLLYAMLLPSANDAALVIAESYGGSISGFVDLMNAKAEALGCTNTHFVNPNGLHDPNHYTTPHDLALIAREAMRNPVFAKIVSTRLRTMPWPAKNERRVLLNLNELLDGSYPGALGVKTGYTSKALHTLVAAAERDGLRLLSVTMRSSLSSRFTDAKAMLEYGFGNYHRTTIVERGATAGSTVIRTQRIPLVAVDPLRIDYEGAQPPAYTTRLALNERPGLLKQGQLAGTLELVVDGKVVASVPVAATKTVRAVPVWVWYTVPALLLSMLIVGAVITGRRRGMSLRSRWSPRRTPNRPRPRGRR
jgi:D-alanyl-D-alanine carboxypeptidase (penicillin-binding protein 5/6)